MIDPFGVCAEKANSNRVFDGILKTVDGSLWSVFGGVAVSAGLAILATAGAPVTMIAAGLVLTTSGCFSIAYGISDGIEGTQDIYYGLTGSTVESINPVRDTVFQGNVEDYWCFRDGAFAPRRGECHDKK